MPTTTNFIATNGLPRKDGETTTVEAACNDNMLHVDQKSDKREAEAVKRNVDNARLAARRMTRATSSLPIHDNERRSKTSFFERDDSNSERPTRFRALCEL